MRLFRSGGVFLMLTAIVSGSSQSSTPQIDAGRRADTYAIYSLLVTGVSGNTSAVLIAAKPIQDLFSQCYEAKTAQTAPPPLPEIINEAAWRELLAEKASRKVSAGTIDPVLVSRRPYVLLSETDIREFTANPGNPKFQGAREYLVFSDIYFDQARTIALVGIASSRSYGSANWQIFKKSPAGEWQSTLNCTVN